MLTTVLVVLASVSFISCGSDDDDNVTPPQGADGTTPPKGGEEVESPEDNLPDVARSFIGYWRNTQSLVSNRDFVFYADGTCDNYWTYGGGYEKSGYWTFNEETNILATTIDTWQWNVTLSNSEAWAGILYGSEKSQSYNRDDAAFVFACLNNTEWECDTLSLRFLSRKYHAIEFIGDDFPNSNRKYNLEFAYREYNEHEVQITSSRIDLDCSIECYGYEHWKKVTITINNYHKSNATLVISNYPDHIYKIKEK